MGQEVCGTAPSNTTHKHQVSDAQTWRKRRGKPCYGRGGGHSRRCRHPKPPGINPAQQNAGSRHQTPHNPQPRVAPRRNLGDAAIFCHAVSELLLADGLTKLVVARNRRLRRPDRKSPRRTGRPMLNLELYVRPPSAHAIGEPPAVSRRGGVPDAPTGPADPVLVPHTPPELSYRTLTTVK